MIWQIFRKRLKIGAPAAGLRGRLGMRGISLVANYSPGNKILTLGVPGPAKSDPSAQRRTEAPT